MPGPAEILFERQGPLAVATLNRPTIRNAVKRGAGERALRAGDGVRAIDQARDRPLVQGEYGVDLWAVVVEKDKKPRWTASSLDQITGQDVERHFTSLDERELSFDE